MTLPIFVTRVKVGRGRDMVMISAESPAGDNVNGEVKSVESARMVVSLATFAEITELFVRTLKTFNTAQAGRPPMTAEQDESGYRRMADNEGVARKH